MERPPKAVLAVDGVSIEEDLAFVKEGIAYEYDIIPLQPEEADRPVQIGAGAFVDGVVFGKTVELASGLDSKPEEMTRVQGVYGEASVNMKDLCIVASHVQSNGEIRIGNSCIIYGDVIGESITIDDDTSIAGNVIADGTITVGRRVTIGGYVISLTGTVVVDDESRVFDIMASGEIAVGSDVVIADPAIHSEGGDISVSQQIMVGDMLVDEGVLGLMTAGQVNTNELRLRSIAYETITDQLGNSLNEVIETIG
jgi:acetyltransferase-like isoleucine patch superfamily enzyme